MLDLPAPVGLEHTESRQGQVSTPQSVGESINQSINMQTQTLSDRYNIGRWRGTLAENSMTERQTDIYLG